MARSKAFVYGGVEIEWVCSEKLIKVGDATPIKDCLHFPGGIVDYLNSKILGQISITNDQFTGSVAVDSRGARIEWAITWLTNDNGFLSSSIFFHRLQHN